MIAEIKIRKATIDDASNLAALCCKTFYDTYHVFNTKENMEMFLEQHFTINKIINELNDVANTFVLLFERDELCGYAKITESKAPVRLVSLAVIEIARIYSIKEKIGKGIGKLLMDECVAIAKQKKKQFIWLGVWKENKRAISFYQKNGFEIFDEQNFILGKDVQNDWLMKKEIF